MRFALINDNRVEAQTQLLFPEGSPATRQSDQKNLPAGTRRL